MGLVIKFIITGRYQHKQNDRKNITRHAIRKFQDRLRRLANEGMIERYLDDIELKVGETISRQIDLRKRTDSFYQKVVLSGDAKKCSALKTALSV